MPFPFALPTTSTVSYPTYFDSPTYPSLPLLAASHRGSLRNALKAHKRLPPASQNANLPLVIKELESYVSHLLALVTALENNEAFLKTSAPLFKTSWRAILTAKKFSTEPPRVARPGLSYEIFWTLSTLAYAYTLQARSQLLRVLSPSVTGSSGAPSTDPQLLFNRAARNLLTSASIFTHLLSRPQPPNAGSWPIELTIPALSALSSLAQADATLIAVIKQDPYPTYLSLTSRERDSKNSTKEWLYNPPNPPESPRALFLARLCIAASDHASKALGLLSVSNTKVRTLLLQLGGGAKSDDVPGEITEDLIRYLESLQKVSRAKSCRFLGIDAESSGRCGEAISWLLLAKSILDVPTTAVDRLRRGLSERKEARHLAAADGSWGLDAGRAEEVNVLEALEVKWRKSNDNIMFQTLPDMGELNKRIPSGREINKLKDWEAPRLDSDEMRALKAEGTHRGYEEEADSEGEGGKEVEVGYAGEGYY
ncbi:hypothetical protein Q9L58_001701 [Maublancomyces gigas]|uniref:pH-response regulator protein palC n=1 Tax=Discina gigas TaxID=1032678 RepID=A0ABR3GTK1_9PEZI